MHVCELFEVWPNPVYYAYEFELATSYMKKLLLQVFYVCRLAQTTVPL